MLAIVSVAFSGCLRVHFIDSSAHATIHKGNHRKYNENKGKTKRVKKKVLLNH